MSDLSALKKILENSPNPYDNKDCVNNGDCRNFKEMVKVIDSQINNPENYKNDKLHNGVYYHQTESDKCGLCGGYDGCLIGCTCPACE